MSDTTAEIRGNSPPTRGAGRKPGSRTRTVAEISEALRKSGGMLGHAARALGISRRALERRLQASPELRGVAVETREQILDVAESALLKAIHAGKLGAITFYLRAFGRHRGWTTGPVHTVVPVPIPHAGDPGGITMEQIRAAIRDQGTASPTTDAQIPAENAPKDPAPMPEVPNEASEVPEPAAETSPAAGYIELAAPAVIARSDVATVSLRSRVHRDRPFIRPPIVRF